MYSPRLETAQSHDVSSARVGGFAFIGDPGPASSLRGATARMSSSSSGGGMPLHTKGARKPKLAKRMPPSGGPTVQARAPAEFADDSTRARDRGNASAGVRTGRFLATDLEPVVGGLEWVPRPYVRRA